MNLGEMKTALSRYAGVDNTDPLSTWLNAALHEFEDAYPWPFLEDMTTQDTVATDDLLTLPADFFQAIKIRVVTDPLPLNYVGRIAFEDQIGDPTVSGKPYIYTLIGMDNMILYPVPDDVYTVRIIYRKLIADLDSDSAVPNIPTKYHYTVVKGAAVLALQAESEESRAETAQKTYDGDVARAIQAFGERQSGDFGQVRDTQGYEDARFSGASTRRYYP